MNPERPLTAREAPAQSAACGRAILWFIAAVVLIECLANALLPEGFMTQTLQSRVREITERPPPTVQIMGDSVAAGIRAWSVNDALADYSVRVANYSLPGTTPIFSPFVLQRQIGANRSPRVIIFAPHPSLLNSPRIERFVARFATGKEIAELHATGAPWTELLFGALCKFSYTLRYREDLSVALTRRDFGFFSTLNKPVAPLAFSEEPVEAPPLPDLDQTLYPYETLPPALRQRLTIDALNVACIHRFCDEAARENIAVLWVSLPTIAANAHTAEEQQRLNHFLDELQSRHANFFVLHREVDTWPDACFMDPRHFSRYGGWKFSRQLGRELAAWLKSDESLAFRDAQRQLTQRSHKIPSSSSD